MKRYKQYEPLIISSFETDEWQHPTHNHNHFEFIYIMKGRGDHYMNDARQPYQQGHLFLLGPEDYHRFEVAEKSHFVYLKFTSLYLQHQQDIHRPADWKHEVDQLLFNKENRNGNLLTLSRDMSTVSQLVSLILNEHQHPESASSTMIYQLFTLLFTVIKRNRHSSHERKAGQPLQGTRLEEIIQYIESNIYHPERLSLKNMASQFYYSPNYFGIFFKEKTGITLRAYVDQYRIKLIERRFRYSADGVKQVAHDLGFVDESHFNKFLKKHTGLAPSSYRQQVRQTSGQATPTKR